jgi:hypothetical protein
LAVYHISLAFVQSPDTALDATVENILTKMQGNPNFVTPDPALPAITIALGGFKSAMTAMNQGGTAATIARDNACAALIVLLRQLVLYIEKTALGDPMKLLSSGFDITSSSRMPVTLNKPAIQGIDFGQAGSVILRCGSMGSASFLKVQYRNGGANWVDGPTSTQARSISVPGLASGTTYEFRVQAGGGNNNVSDWSDPVSHVAG